MDTVFSFDVRPCCDGPAGRFAGALNQVVAWLDQVERTFSVYREDSIISRLGRGELCRAGCGPEVNDVLDLCEQVARRSEGYFTLTPNGRLNPSGLVKGWAVARASKLLRSAGAHRHSVNGGGDVQLCGGKAAGEPWRVGVANPLRPRELATVVTGRDLAVATSGTAERGNHILDPHSGRPACVLASITLVGSDLTLVDAYATAAFAMGDAARDWVEGLTGIEAYAVTRDGRTWWTSGFPEVGLVRR